MAKIRKGFVSNSSSSSFVCCITGQTEGGYDVGLREVGFCECVNGHTFSYGSFPKVEAWLDGEVIEGFTEEDDDRDEYEVPASICPVCNGEAKGMIITRLKCEMKDLNIKIEDLK